MQHSNQAPIVNPVPGVGVYVLHEEHVLLIRRSKPPGMGEWALPGGKVELGETLQQTGEREVLEETGVIVRAGESLFTFDSIERDESGAVLRHLVIIDLVAEYVGGKVIAGDDALEARWVGREELEEITVHFMTLRFLREIVKFVR